MPTVSIIVPCYNHGRLLGEAIQSVLTQTNPDFEVIVVDDGSTDNTREVVNTFSHVRLRYVYQENKGLAGARNTGIQLSRGKYLAFLDADDWFLPNKLENQVYWMESHHDYGFVAGGWSYIDENGKILSVQQPWQAVPRLDLIAWLFYCPVVPASILVQKCWIEKVGGFDPNFRRVEDWDLWLRLAYAGCRMAWIHEIVCAYRMSPGQMTRDAAEQKRVTVRMMDKFFGQNDLPDDLRNLRPKVYANILISSAGREYGVSQCADAQASIAEAIRFDPSLLDKNLDMLVIRLLSWVDDPFIGDPIGYTRRIFDHLPPEAAKLRTKRRWALGEVALRMFFKAHKLRAWKQVQQAGLIVALNAPQRMFNRGIWSILYQSLMKGRESRE